MDNSSKQSLSFPDVYTVENDEIESPRHVHTSGSDENRIVTPGSQSSSFIPDAENYDDIITPKRFRSIEDVYRDTKEIETEDELLLMGIDEPNSYTHAVKDKA